MFDFLFTLQTLICHITCYCTFKAVELVGIIILIIIKLHLYYYLCQFSIQN